MSLTDSLTHLLILELMTFETVVEDTWPETIIILETCGLRLLIIQLPISAIQIETFRLSGHLWDWLRRLVMCPMAVDSVQPIFSLFIHEIKKCILCIAQSQ